MTIKAEYTNTKHPSWPAIYIEATGKTGLEVSIKLHEELCRQVDRPCDWMRYVK